MNDFSNMSIPRFGFAVSFIIYLGLLFAEYLRPGFVSHVMNAHILWIAIIGFGAYELAVDSESMNAKKQSRGSLLVSIIVGILLALIIWRLGSIFGDMRLFFALAVGILPFVLLK